MESPDENAAPFVRSATVAYHCPNTACDGHFYLRDADLGVQRTCLKCGLTLTIGTYEAPGDLPNLDVPANPRKPWHWKDRVIVAAWIAIFLLFLRPIFDQAHPFGTDSLTVRLISTVLISAMTSGGAAAILGLLIP